MDNLLTVAFEAHSQEENHHRGYRPTWSTWSSSPTPCTPSPRRSASTSPASCSSWGRDSSSSGTESQLRFLGAGVTLEGRRLLDLVHNLRRHHIPWPRETPPTNRFSTGKLSSSPA